MAAATAKLEGRAVSAAKGPMKRLMGRLTYSSVASALLLCSGAFGSDFGGSRRHMCMPLSQPYISDACGALGLGDWPAREERIAWERREPGSCAALRVHIERFPKGAYRAEATSLLSARRPTQAEVWTPVTRRLALFQPQEYPASSSEAKAGLPRWPGLRRARSGCAEGSRRQLLSGSDRQRQGARSGIAIVEWKASSVRSRAKPCASWMSGVWSKMRRVGNSA